MKNKIRGALGLLATLVAFLSPVAFAATPKLYGANGDSLPTLAIKANGSLWHWGGNGQSPTPLLVNLTDVVDVSGRYALRGDGTVWDIGETTISERPTPVAGLSGITRIAAGALHLLALKSDGTLWSKGDNQMGQLGRGTVVFGDFPPEPIPGMTGVTAIAAEGFQSLAVKSNGTVWAWGDDRPLTLVQGTRDSCAAGACVVAPRQVAGLSGIVKVMTGWPEHFALKGDGTVWVWGKIFWQQAYEVNYPVPTQLAQPTGVVDIAMGRGHYLMRTSAGHVWGFGFNLSGQMGAAASQVQSTPVQLTATPTYAGVWAMYDCTFFMRTDGQLLGMGNNTAGRLGDNSQLDRSTLTAVTGRDGRDFFNLLGANTTSTPQLLTVQGPATLRSGESGAYFATAAFANGLSKAVKATFTSGDATVALSPDGRLVTSAATAGRVVPILAAYSESGLGLTQQFTVTVSPGSATPRPPSISANEGTHTLALRSDGTVVAWGENRLEQLGDATRIDRTAPIQTVQISDVKQVVASGTGSLALKADGTVHQWGFQVGTTPLPVNGLTNVKAISTGNRGNSAFVVTQAGSLLEWNQFTGITSIALSLVDQVVATQLTIDSSDGSKSGHVLARRTDGTVYSWGENARGELGDGTRAAHAAPAVVPGLTNVVQVAAGGSFGAEHSFAVKADGTLWAWGSQYLGVLGDGVVSTCRTPALSCPAQLTPKQITAISNVKAVAIGTFHNVAVKHDGTVWTWGDNFTGQLGDGTRVSKATPVQVAGLTGIVAVQAGGGHSLALKSDGTVYAWGWNNIGQLGDGTFVDRDRPVLVLQVGGAGAVDSGNWFLDLDPAAPNSVPAAFVPQALAVARKGGTDTSINLDATIKYRTADLGKGVKNYVLGLVPPSFFSQVRTAPGLASPASLAKRAKATGLVLAQLTPAGWVDVQGQLIAYSSGVANAGGGGTRILDGVSLPSGGKFCVGYGESADAMLSSGTLRDVLSLQGATGDVAGTPCVISGVYVDGPASSALGTPVSLLANVIGLDPSGTVQFRNGFGLLGSPLTIAPINPAVSRATLTTAALAAGVHSIGADYSGDNKNPAAAPEFPFLHVVLSLQQESPVSISGPASSNAGDEVTFLVNVTGNVPTGTVQFRDGATNLGAPVPLNAAGASLRTAALGPGVHSITAAYSGDAKNPPATSPALAHRVEEYIATRVALAASANPSSVGSSVVLTATVTGNAPTGTVAFRAGAAVMATVPLSGGVASLTVTGFSPGVHTLTADYSGDGANPPASSESISQSVLTAVDPAGAARDDDGDGLTNAVEAAEGRNPFIKDNDIFGNPRWFAMQQYRDFLAREGDAAGVNFWASQIAAGAASRGQVVDSFFSSPEFQGNIAPVARLYFAYFLRIPDYAGLNFWIGFYKSGNPLATISQNFATSPEFGTRYGALDNGQFVDLVYQNVLGRAPDVGGRAFWKGQLDTGAMDRGTVMLGFSESDEYRLMIASEVYVTMIYNGMLRRAPDASGFSFWVQYRDAGNPGLALIDLFLGTPEYRARFLP